MTSVPAGWYPNPYDPAVELYWDGTDWTSQSRPATGAVAATPAGWYDDGSGRPRWWDGTAWTDSYQDAAVSVEQAPVPAPQRPRSPWLKVGLVAGGALVLAIAVVVGVVLALQPRYASTSPLSRADVDNLVDHATGAKLEQHMNDTEIIDGTDPRGCGIIAQFGTGLRTPADETSGLTFYQVWGKADDDVWLNARLFANEDESADFLDDVEDAARDCPTYQRPGDDTEWTVSNVTREPESVQFDVGPHDVRVALIRVQNSVYLFLLQGDATAEEYLDALEY